MLPLASTHFSSASRSAEKNCAAMKKRALGDFKQPRRPHAAADAHRYHYQLRAAALAFDERVADQAGARHSARMADRDGAAVHVEALVRDTELVAAVHHLYGERLVQLPQVDVRHLLAGRLQELRHGEHWADAHLVGLTTGDREAAIDAKRLQPSPGSFSGTHDDRRGSAVGELAGVAGGDDAALD